VLVSAATAAIAEFVSGERLPHAGSIPVAAACATSVKIRSLVVVARVLPVPFAGRVFAVPLVPAGTPTVVTVNDSPPASATPVSAVKVIATVICGVVDPTDV